MNIGDYFENIWKPEIDKYRYSGWQLLIKVNLGQKILDVGCGYHPFKPYLKDSIIGIDPYNDAADIRVRIEDYYTNELFDAVFCLGSINFGKEHTILKQISKVVFLTKPGGTIYWRQNPGLQDHDNEECKSIDFFDWSFEKNLQYAKMFNCEVEMLAWDTDNRIYSEWKRLS